MNNIESMNGLRKRFKLTKVILLNFDHSDATHLYYTWKYLHFANLRFCNENRMDQNQESISKTPSTYLHKFPEK